MKVQVSVTVDIDPAKWDAEYHTGTDAATVREDVKNYMAGVVEDQVERLGVGASKAPGNAARCRARGHQDALNGLRPQSDDRDYLAGWSSR